MVLRPPSQRNSPRFKSREHRLLSATAFHHQITEYDRVRPGYGEQLQQLMPQDLSSLTIHDMGAGTGKLTGLFARLSHHSQLSRPYALTASDPSPDMVRIFRSLYPHIPVWRATAENTALADSSVDLIGCAQTWHWVDIHRSCQECDRILKPGGKILLAWNTLDVSEPWVLRLARIMHSGDIQREGFEPELATPFVVEKELRDTWVQEVSPRDIHTLTHTRSYWLRSNETIRKRVTDNLNWYLHEHLGFGREEKIALPYRLDAFVVGRSADKSKSE
ncbi:methyltransferase domain-containing protein [Corynebacterium poyangense]|uniref:Methyltransferase domain-containing protein n=1 Tax=Corynebacterium poyangense TaxID=2684405 RepID=A0A7H0SNQ8_9CORY|nr:methyltransferase domain-containing protein [Corynebacterium poyangense]